MSIHRAEQTYNVPFSTLRDRMKNGYVSGPTMGRKTIFTSEQEELMAQEIKMLSKLFYGLTPMEIRGAAFEFAEKNRIPHTFNGDTGVARRAWFDGFMKRHPTLSVRRPENTSFNRIKAFNREEVSKFFDNWQIILDKYNFSPGKIYNMDETGISAVNESLSIVAEKGQKRVGKVASGERGKNVTVICAINAAGEYIPPMFVFPRQRMTPALQTGGPDGSAYHCSANGYSNSVLFLKWLEHFIQHTRCSKADPVVIILDNHDSHISIESYEICRENGIALLSLPPHTSHRMQPLDLSFFGPLKNAFRKESDAQLKKSKGTKITVYDLASVFKRAYIHVSSQRNAISRFEVAGIWPFNRNRFSNDDYVPADVLRSLETHRSDTETTASTSTSETTSTIQEDPSSLGSHAEETEISLYDLNLLEGDFINLNIPIIENNNEFILLNELSSTKININNNEEGEGSRECEESEDNAVQKIGEVLNEQRRDIEVSSVVSPSKTSCLIDNIHGSSNNNCNESNKAAAEIPSQPVAHQNIHESVNLVDTPRSHKSARCVRSLVSRRMKQDFQSELAEAKDMSPTSYALLNRQAVPSLSLNSPQHQARLPTPSLVTPRTHQLLLTSSPITHLVKPFITSLAPRNLALSGSPISSSLSTVSSTENVTSPKATEVQKGRKKQHSQVLTNSPMKEVLETKKSKRIEREEKSHGKKIKHTRVKKEIKKSPKTKQKQKKKFSLSGKSKCSRGKEAEPFKDTLEQNQNSSSNCICSVCKEFGKNELWYRCRDCGTWSHAECVSASSADEYFCDGCL